MKPLTLERLASTFTVRDVMVPRSRLVCGSSPDECARLLAENPEYNLIPVLDGDRIAGYVDRAGGHGGLHLHRDVISDSTSLLDLIDALADQSFRFVLVGPRVEG